MERKHAGIQEVLLLKFWPEHIKTEKGSTLKPTVRYAVLMSDLKVDSLCLVRIEPYRSNLNSVLIDLSTYRTVYMPYYAFILSGIIKTSENHSSHFD